MNPAFWANVAPSIKPYDRMEVRCDDGAFFAELLVLHSDRTFAKVRMLTFLDLQAKPEAAGDSKTKGKDKKDKTTTDEPVGEMDKYEYKFRGPQCKHSIIRKSDNAVMVEKLESKEAAIQWLTEFVNKAA